MAVIGRLDKGDYMIWCMGLPRCGGQSLLCLFSECKWEAWHSIEWNRWDVVTKNTRAIIECYAPIAWCEKSYRTKQKHKYVVNVRRDTRAWLLSCEKMAARAEKENWSHPLWRRPQSQWLDFYNEYYDQKYADLDRLGCDFITVDVTQKDPQELAEFVKFTGVPWPEACWPNYDRFARFNARVTETHVRVAMGEEGGGSILGVTF